VEKKPEKFVLCPYSLKEDWGEVLVGTCVEKLNGLFLVVVGGKNSEQLLQNVRRSTRKGKKPALLAYKGEERGKEMVGMGGILCKMVQKGQRKGGTWGESLAGNRKKKAKGAVEGQTEGG